MEATGRPTKSIVSTIAHTIRLDVTETVHLITNLQYLQDFFQKLLEVKVKAGIFLGLQIKKIVEVKEYPKKLTRTQKAAWDTFVAVVQGFFGSHKDKS